MQGVDSTEWEKTMIALRDSPLVYAIPPIALGLATLAAYPLHSIVPYSPEYVFLLFVILTGWFAGRGAGLVTATLAPLILDYFYLPPLHTLGFSPEAWRLMFPFMLFSMGAAWFASVRTKARHAESALRQNQDRFSRILTSLPDIVWTISNEGRIIYLSPTIESVTGYAASELYQKDLDFLLENIHPEDIESVRDAVRGLFSTGTPFDIEYRFRCKDGHWIWLHNRATETYRAGETLLADGVINDISRGKIAELDVKAKNALLEAQINSTIDGILVVDDLGKIVQQNRRFTEIFQLPEELLDINDDQLVRDHVESLIADHEAFIARVKYLYAHRMETSRDKLKLKDGRFLDRYSSPVIDESGRYHGRIWTFRDITERERSEAELKSKTALLGAQINSTIDGILVLDTASQRILQNRRFFEIFKFPPELQASSDGAQAREYAKSLMKDPAAFQAKFDYLKNRPMETSRDEIELKDGTVLDRYSAPVVDEAGHHYGRIWTFRDITERKRSEDKLRQLSMAVEQSPAVVVITDPTGKINYVNRKFTECTGYSPSEVLGKNPRILNSGYSSPETYKALWQTITQGCEWRGEFRNRKKNGELYWEAATITPILDSAGAITNFLALKEDITSQKAAERNLAKAKIVAEEANRKLRAKHLALEEERQILRALINNVPDLMFVKDAQSRFVVANAQTARSMRVSTPNELLGKTDFDFLPPEIARNFYEDDQEVLRSGNPLYNREELCLDENGNEIQVLTTKVPIRDREGKITGIAGVGRNISARKQMENALREAEQKFRGIFDNAPVGIFQSTPEGRFLNVNPSMASIFGYDSPEEMVTLIDDIDRQFYAVSKDRDDFKARVASLGGVQSYECEAYRKDGKRIWLSMSVRGIFEGGVAIRYEGMCEDITQQKLLREQLLQAQKLESVGQLAAGIAHEINTPTQFVTDNLAFLRGAWSTSSHLLERYRNCVRDAASALGPTIIALLENEEEEADLAFISSEVPAAIDQGLDGMRRVAQIVKAMKEFSHPDSGDKVQLDLNRAIESTITIARSEWKYVADVVTDFEAALPLVVCYPGEINQVVLNLLVNASHAIKDKGKEGERGKIAISTRSRGRFAEISISDTGTGIPLSIQTRIYEPFFTTKDVGKGTGQGLAMAHSVVVKKHHGKIWFTSEMGVGTTFFIDLPFEPEGAGKEH